MPAMISGSVLVSPGGSAPFQCHCSTRLLLTNEPSSSAKQVDGNLNTSVWILAGSTSLTSPWFCHKTAVAVASGPIVTTYLSFANAPSTLALHGSAASGSNPCQK